MAKVKVSIDANGKVVCDPSDLVVSSQPETIEWYKDANAKFEFKDHQNLPKPPFEPPKITPDQVKVDYLGQVQDGNWQYKIRVKELKGDDDDERPFGDGSGTIRNH